jgi:D-arabinose 1-dehydrogenase-like Zn-dependent alcohol dehydrogenase
LQKLLVWWAKLKILDWVGLEADDECLLGIDAYCLNSNQFGSANHDQGCFGTGVAWDVSALHKIPDEIASEYAGPLMCGGATVWGPLYQHGIKAGDRVGIVGIGGLGHMAIQFASKMGMDVVVFSSTEDKKEEALKFGANEFVATKGLTTFEGVKPIDFLLITTSAQPDYAL